MSPVRIEDWADRLGLACAPLFDAGPDDGGVHQVLLDGGNGSFAVSDGADIDPALGKSWAWSSDLPHHVFIKNEIITVSRWDRPITDRLQRAAVESRLADFYRYLLLDRIQSRGTVVEHSIELFRRLRSLLEHKSLPHEAAVDIFLVQLTAMADRLDIADAGVFDQLLDSLEIEPTAAELARSVRVDLGQLGAEFQRARQTMVDAVLFADLAIRHAGGAIFQEAHFQLQYGASPDLFGDIGAATVKVNTRGGVHFTPPALARILAEEALREVGSKPEYSVYDPACGSGAFLYEFVRALGRNNFHGNVRVIGRDVSRPAIAMAKFMLARASHDWPSIALNIDVSQANSLEEDGPWGQCDLILMNPPFISWAAQSPDQRREMRQVLGERLMGQPDYCMAFIERAISKTRAGTVVGTLLPASLLSLRSAAKWRQHLSERATPVLISSFGDYGLFQHALVQVGALVAKVGQPVEGAYRELWAAENADATSEALRALRKLRDQPSDASGEGWSISTSLPVLDRSTDWRPRPRKLRNILEGIRSTVPTNVDSVFRVHEGIRSGLRAVFVLDANAHARLPARERKYFRPVAEGTNIRNGKISPRSFVFYPTSADLEPIGSEGELKDRLPNYYKGWLLPKKSELSGRPAVQTRTVTGGGKPWWELNRPRPWQSARSPKIVSAYFGLRGSYAFDDIGDYVVLQGHAWLPKRASVSRGSTWSARLFKAYVALLNSRPFELLLAEFCPRVAGGQFNLSKRFVDGVPLPNLSELLSASPGNAALVDRLSKLGEKQFTDNAAAEQIDQTVAQLYGVSLDQWESK